MNENASAPSPFFAATLMVSRLVQAIHIGGCGFCTGFGSTLRQGIEKQRPSKPGYGSGAPNFGVLAWGPGALPRLFFGGVFEAPRPRRGPPSPASAPRPAGGAGGRGAG